MKTVVYYTSTYFMDTSCEIINIIKSRVNLHVLIEVTPSSKNATIISIDKLPEGKVLCVPEEILSSYDYGKLKPYFEGTASVHFVVHHHHTGLSLKTFNVFRKVNKFIRSKKPDAIHFESFSLRTLGLTMLFPAIDRVAISVHDALLHSGEQSWKTKLPRFVLFRMPVKKVFFFYSEFCLDHFPVKSNYGKRKLLLKMGPYSYFGRLAANCERGHEHLLFFGRISKYKGLDLLLDAMPGVLQQFPNEKLVIAGGGADANLLNHPTLLKPEFNTSIINRYIENDELVALISKSKMVICPYIDATQSGVLMTAFAISKPAIATKVGAFKESIVPGINGLLVEKVTAACVTENIITALTDNKYLSMEKNLQQQNAANSWKPNTEILLKGYFN